MLAMTGRDAAAVMPPEEGHRDTDEQEWNPERHHERMRPAIGVIVKPPSWPVRSVEYVPTWHAVRTVRDRARSPPTGTRGPWYEYELVLPAGVPEDDVPDANQKGCEDYQAGRSTAPLEPTPPFR